MTQHCSQHAGRLGDVRILIVEDEPLLAMTLQSMLEDEGARIVGPACNIHRAVALAKEESISVAVLDIRLGHDSVEPVARALAGRNIPFMFYSGQPANDPVRAEWPAARMIQKPASPDSVIDAVTQLVDRRS